MARGLFGHLVGGIDREEKGFLTSYYDEPIASGERPASAPGKKVGRNDPCPCGSALKYKKCCGA